MALNYKSYQFTSTAPQGVNAVSCSTTSCLVRSATVYNSTGSTLACEIQVSKSGASAVNIQEFSVAAGGTQVLLSEPVILENGDAVRIVFENAGLTAFVSYVESTAVLNATSVKELSDWSSTTPLNGQVPVWNNTLGEYVPTTSSGTITDTDGLSEGTTNLYYTNARADARIAAASIEDLSDVAAMTPSTNQVLQWNGSTWTAGTVSGGGGSSTLDGLTDVSATSPTNGDVIVYASGTSTWTTSGALQNLVALLKQPTADTTTIEADTNNKITIDKTSAAEKVVATVDGTDALVIKDTHVETKGVIVENQGRLTLRETTANGTNYIGFQAPASVTTSTNFVMPDGDGTAGQFLKTDGSANLSWATPSGGGAANMSQTFSAPTNSGEFQTGARLVVDAYGTNPAATAGTLSSFGNTAAAAVGAQSAAAAATGMLTVVTDAGDSDELLVEGVVKMSTATTTTLLPTTAKKGTPVYMSTTAGAVTTTAPSGTGEFVRVVGHVVDATNRTIYFKPDNTWLEL